MLESLTGPETRLDLDFGLYSRASWGMHGTHPYPSLSPSLQLRYLASACSCIILIRHGHPRFCSWTITHLLNILGLEQDYHRNHEMNSGVSPEWLRYSIQELEQDMLPGVARFLRRSGIQQTQQPCDSRAERLERMAAAGASHLFESTTTTVSKVLDSWRLTYHILERALG